MSSARPHTLALGPALCPPPRTAPATAPEAPTQAGFLDVGGSPSVEPLHLSAGPHLLRLRPCSLMAQLLGPGCPAANTKAGLLGTRPSAGQDEEAGELAWGPLSSQRLTLGPRLHRTQQGPSLRGVGSTPGFPVLRWGALMNPALAGGPLPLCPHGTRPGPTSSHCCS